MTGSLSPEPLAFRDPAGRLLSSEGRLLRFVTEPGAAESVRRALASKTWRTATEQGRVVASKLLSPDEAQAHARRHAMEAACVVEHEHVLFPSYPHEWTPSMLHAAARLTLDLARGLAPEGLGLKDATPLNVLFEGQRPVFVDLPSVEVRDPHDPTWRPYAQFERTFLLPLLAHREFTLALADVFLARRDGLEPAEIYRMAGPLRRLKPSLFSAVTIPIWLERLIPRPDERLYRRRHDANPARAQFVLQAVLRSLARRLSRLAPRGRSSAWTGYEAEAPGYSPAQRDQKRRFFARALARVKPSTFLDLGANTGEYSFLAARAGARVVATDRDAAAVEILYRRAAAEAATIQPLVVDIARPSPAVGWANRESLSFLDRAAGAFDLVAALALLHHLVVSERIPLEEVVRLLHRLTRSHVLVEFVGSEDPMFRRLLRGRDDLFARMDAESFSSAVRAHFEVVEREELSASARTLFLLRRRDG